MAEVNIQYLLLIWCMGAALAAFALLIPVYIIFVIIGAIGWILVGLSTFLIFNHIKK